MILECHDCGLRHVAVGVPAGYEAQCARCGAALLPRPGAAIEISLALSVTGLILVAIANATPLMSLRLEGHVQEATLAGGAIALAQNGLWPLAALIMITTVVVPLAKLAGTTYVLLPKGAGAPRHVRFVFRWIEKLRPWAMIEVYLLGVFVAYVKLTDIAAIEIGVALYALGALMVVMAVIDSTLDAEAVWRALVPAVDSGSDSETLARCASCALVSGIAKGSAICPRCGASLHERKRDSLQRSWALAIAAFILYLPANYFPVMTVQSFGSGEPDTILSGVKHLIASGMWPLALLVFFASITVPVLKLLSLGLLLATTQRRSRWRIHERTVLYRLVEGIGRWSMIDIFMLSVLVALVRLGSIASIEPGAGALAFAAVVVITMIAATSFDPRLMWDSAGANP